MAHARLRLQFRQTAIDPGGRLQHRALAGERHQKRHHAARHGRPGARKQVFQVARRAAAGIRHVDMGIGAITDQDIGAGGHGRRGVRMQVKADDQRHLRPDRPAYPGDQLALPILQVLRHHGAVEVEIDRVEGGLQPGQHDRRHPLEGILGDVGGRHGAGPGDGLQLVAVRARDLGETARRDVGLGQQIEDGAPQHQARKTLRTKKIRPGRPHRREGIRFVQETRMRDDRHGAVPPPNLSSTSPRGYSRNRRRRNP